MSSLDVALFALDSWRESGASLRAYRVFSDRALMSEVKVIGVHPDKGTASILADGDSVTWTLSGASFEYVEEDKDLPDEITKVFAGRFLEIELSTGDLIVVGELLT